MNVYLLLKTPLEYFFMPAASSTSAICMVLHTVHSNGMMLKHVQDQLLPVVQYMQLDIF